jgi:hypothetical protein
MFPDNPEINDMINTLKTGFEERQESDMKRDSKTLFKKTVKSNSSTNEFKSVNKVVEKPIVVERKEEKSSIL